MKWLSEIFTGDTPPDKPNEAAQEPALLPENAESQAQEQSPPPAPEPSPAQQFIVDELPKHPELESLITDAPPTHDDSPQAREHAKFKRKKAWKRPADSPPKPKEVDAPVSIQREILQLLRELNRSGIAMNALVVLVADRVDLHRPGKPPITWNRKKEIVKEVLLAAQMTTETLGIKNKE